MKETDYSLKIDKLEKYDKRFKKLTSENFLKGSYILRQ